LSTFARQITLKNIDMITANSIPELLRYTSESFPGHPALGYTEAPAMTYSDLQARVEQLAVALQSTGVKKGDRIIILSHNMPEWGLAYFAVTSTGAIAVPLMPDFKPAEIAKIIEHSGATMAFVSKQLSPNLPDGFYRIIMEEIELFAQQTQPESGKIDFAPVEILKDDLASIIYTSGTTGDPKGVMLSHENILFTVEGCAAIQPAGPDDRFLSVLPLSHIYEFTLGLMLPVSGGASVTYLRKPPTAPVLLPAMASVKPTIMLTVPLLIEKVYWKSVYPKFNSSPVLKTLYKIPPFKKLLHRVAGKKLYQTFGGCLKFYGIGGSKLDARVETFLRDGRFPYAIGYGLTETSPLLAGGSPFNFPFQSTGKAMQGVELKIDLQDAGHDIGEIMARGKNIMKGYYKSPEITAEVLDEEGWFRTGDLGSFDKHGNLSIRGRIKTTIIGANGKNIFPEEIESVINSMDFVKESLVLEAKGRLIGLVHLDYEALDAHYRQFREDADRFKEQVNTVLKDIHHRVNTMVNKFSRLQAVQEHQTPFERTPTQKIKRFLYSKRD